MKTTINGIKVASKYQGQTKQPSWHRPDEPYREHFQISIFGETTHECFDFWQPNGERSMKEEDLLEAVEMIASDATIPEEHEDAAEFLNYFGYITSEEYIRNGLKAWEGCKQTAEAFERLGIDSAELGEAVRERLDGDD